MFVQLSIFAINDFSHFLILRGQTVSLKIENKSKYISDILKIQMEIRRVFNWCKNEAEPKKKLI